MVGSTKSEAPESSFRGWLAGKKATEQRLIEYLASVGEWWNSEFKAATTEIDYGLRKTVCALANTDGGEVFLGVQDDKSLTGTDVNGDRIEQILRQEKARPGDWYVVDLNEAVSQTFPITLAKRSGKRVHILEVKPPGVPAFVLERDNELSLFIRQGGSSVKANSFKALEWQRKVTREDLLRNCYLELKTLSRTVGGMHLGLAANLGLTVPYLTNRLQDGTIYKLLTDEDLLFLLGRARGRSGYEGGIYQDLFEARYEITKEMNMGMERHEVDQSIEEILDRAGESLRNRAESLLYYLHRNGISAD